jgi:hypothetical protein
MATIQASLANAAEFFNSLLEHLRLSSPAISIVSLVATDDLTGKRPRVKLAWQVYEKLSTGSALVPPALSFSLDREGRSEKEILSMTQDSRGKVKFLPRRTYENYLIDYDAISQLLSDASGRAVTVENIRDWINAKISDRAYLDGPVTEGVDWICVVNAPEMLYDLFNAMTEATVEYRKTRHSVDLTKWLLANKPESLNELFEYVKGLVPFH